MGIKYSARKSGQQEAREAKEKEKQHEALVLLQLKEQQEPKEKQEHSGGGGAVCEGKSFAGSMVITSTVSERRALLRELELERERKGVFRMKLLFGCFLKSFTQHFFEEALGRWHGLVLGRG